MRMRNLAYWVCNVGRGNLGIMPRPLGGQALESQMNQLKTEGTDVLVSMLTAPEVDELDLRKEPEACSKKGIRFLNFPVPDQSVPPDRAAFEQLIRDLTGELLAGRGVVIHCHGGIGRSGLAAACILVGQGRSPEGACLTVSMARRYEVPSTEEQRQWISSWPSYQTSLRDRE
jgi:protein-tyrosine phosphatase